MRDAIGEGLFRRVLANGLFAQLDSAGAEIDERAAVDAIPLATTGQFRRPIADVLEGASFEREICEAQCQCRRRDRNRGLREPAHDLLRWLLAGNLKSQPVCER